MAHSTQIRSQRRSKLGVTLMYALYRKHLKNGGFTFEKEEFILVSKLILDSILPFLPHPME